MYCVPLVADIKKLAKKDGYKFDVVSLFAGGGGSSTGYRMAGGKVLAISEFIEEARATYSANWPDTIIFPQDVRELTANELLTAINKQPGELDILDGSPPCSGFSTAGKREKLWGKTKSYSDSRYTSVETLFYEYIRLVDSIKPKVFVAENVKGLTLGVSRGYFNEFLRLLACCNYTVVAKILDAQWLGVPQTRSRLIIVGIRNDICKKEFSSITHPKPFSYRVSLREAFTGLSLTEDERLATDISKYQVYQRLIKLPPGYSDSKRFNLVKAHPDRPSACITATAGAGCACVHHWDNRLFSIRELKRIVSLPDDYILTGNSTQQRERMGRMVPPLMMKAIAENIYNNILTPLTVA